MEESKGNEFILMIRALWNEQKKREVLYLEALKKDGMGPFRRVLSQGHVSAVLFQKEIRAVYDYFKCFLNDKELADQNQIASHASLQLLENANGKEEVASCLKKIEAATLQLYKSLRHYLDREPEAQRLMDEHLTRTSEFYEMLCKLESGTHRSYGLTAAA
ncbi:hypothetical protein ACN9ML_14795 [Dyadobacter endophyticus]|uniref:Ferritin n=1 Tax=Dyadobacter endophyticus TaxID=1749036 RepID=A0ABQ1Z1K4_9BACT|nr:hypothetical protein [Dyadobacter endophyticus]GGH43741.1 hypothetical protein GCM10007423_41360 [Dyadobacter endophyticus]